MLKRWWISFMNVTGLICQHISSGDDKPRWRQAMKVNKGISAFCSPHIYIPPNYSLLPPLFSTTTSPRVHYFGFCGPCHLYPRWRGDVWMRRALHKCWFSKVAFSPHKISQVGGHIFSYPREYKYSTLKEHQITRILLFIIDRGPSHVIKNNAKIMKLI